MPFRQPSPGNPSSSHDRHLEAPSSYEALLQENNELKTRVRELEVINGLYQGHMQQNSRPGPQTAPPAEMLPRQDPEGDPRDLLEQSRQREDQLKRQIDELEREVSELKGEEPPTKRSRPESLSEYPEPPTSLT